MKKLPVPEVALPVVRAGFVPSYEDNGPDIELWQIWMRSGDTERRATFGDLKAAGFKRRKKR